MNQARLVQSLGWLAFLALLILTGSFSCWIAKLLAVLRQTRVPPARTNCSKPLRSSAVSW